MLIRRGGKEPRGTRSRTDDVVGRGEGGQTVAGIYRERPRPSMRVSAGSLPVTGIDHMRRLLAPHHKHAAGSCVVLH
jgi:hypothetical protein